MLIEDVLVINACSKLTAGLITTIRLKKIRGKKFAWSKLLVNEKYVMYYKRIHYVRFVRDLIGERSEPLSYKLGGEICIATRALVCI